MQVSPLSTHERPLGSIVAIVARRVMDTSTDSNADSYTRPPVPLFLQRILTSRTVPPSPPSQVPNGTQFVPQPIYLPPPALPVIEEDLVPPENFALVSSGVYRSGFPMKRNFRFMESLKLKTVL